MAANSRRALVVGSTGITGQALARNLSERGWETFGLSRSGSVDIPGVTNVTADLRDPEQLAGALAEVRPNFVGITAWIRHDTEAENVVVNGGIVRNVLTAVTPSQTVEHVALMTGLKHYLGPFEAYGTMVVAETPFHEWEQRLDYPNFYYAQEDEVFASAKTNGFSWSVHRSHTVQGFATGNAMNMVLTIAVYATLCKELGMPFIFPGSEAQWNLLTDMTDADLLAEQMIWCAENEAGQNEAFNTANGDVFRWRWMWKQWAEHFGIESEGFNGEIRTLDSRMRDMAEPWRKIAQKYRLIEPDITKLASWWHTDGDLGRPIEVITDMTKSRSAGFLGFRDTTASFFARVEQYRAARIIP